MVINKKFVILFVCIALILLLILVLPHCAALASGSTVLDTLKKKHLDTIEKVNASEDIADSFSVLITVVSAIVSGIGEIITLWGISEWGISFQSTDGGIQAQAMKKIVGGLIILAAPQIMVWLVTADTVNTA